MQSHDDYQLAVKLTANSNALLTAVVQGARKEEPDDAVRAVALDSLGSAIELVTSNFENEGERNYIMQVICEATQASNTDIQQNAYGCLIKIIEIYYSKMRFYMEKALFGLTIQGMKSDNEDVAKLAVWFWATVCHAEIRIEDENLLAQDTNTPTQDFFNFARIATQEVVPVILSLLTKQEEDADEDDYNLPQAAYECLTLWAQAVGNSITAQVVPFVERNLRDQDWHKRDAAVASFGAIMAGPDAKHLDPLIKQALPVLLEMMQDPVVHVKDSTAYALGRICEFASESVDSTLFQNLIQSLFQGLGGEKRVATSCCSALGSLADQFGRPDAETGPLSPHFQASVSALLQLTENCRDNSLRTAAYEVLNMFVMQSANDSVGFVKQLADVILLRLENTLALQQQVVSVDDRLTLQEIQTSLVTVTSGIVVRLSTEISQLSDRIMHVFLQILGASGAKSSVPEDIFAATGSLASAIGHDFAKYMGPFKDYWYKALQNQEEEGLCFMAIGLVGDFSNALDEQIQPYCDQIVTLLLSNLRDTTTRKQETRPLILQTFGDLASAIGGHFESYLEVIGTVLQEAARLSASNQSQDIVEYVTKLREGIMDAWAGIITAMRHANKPQLLQPFVEPIFQLLQVIFQEESKLAESLLNSCMGVIGDIAEAFPNGQFSHYFRQDFLTAMCREVRANKNFAVSVQNNARWAREQIKRQAGMCIVASRRSNLTSVASGSNMQ